MTITVLSVSLPGLRANPGQSHGNSISTTDSNGDLNLAPNGTGTVKVPSNYHNRAGFSALSLVTKEYVDAIKSNLDLKYSVKVATTANINLNATQTIDGVSVSAGDRVLAKNQSDASENGIWVVSGSDWARATDADSSAEVTSGMFVFVEKGTTNADSGLYLIHI